MQNNDFLAEEYTIDTPENVTFGYEVVGIGSRFVAAIIDTIIIFLGLILLAFIVLVILSTIGDINFDVDSIFTEGSGEWIGGIIVALYSLANFIIFWGYYIFFELIWNGQTPGKQVAKIRVVRMDGNPVGFLQSAIRNLVRFVDFLPSAYGIGLITMFFSPNSRRLGDFAAGTIVIRDKTEVSLDSLVGGSASSQAGQQTAKLGSTDPRLSGDQATFSASMAAPSLAQDPLLAQFVNIRDLSTGDYELITDTLARYKAKKLDGLMVSRLAIGMAKKLDVKLPALDSQANARFLEDVAEAYRRYQ